ncbi:Nn.00g105210.m01.CDS01 [Neocucurbitaria sp. VM-36]
MSSTNTTPKPAPKSQVEDFLHRANKAKIHTEETGSGMQEETWEVILDEDDAKKTTQDEMDKEEWVLVGRTEGDMQRR